MKSVIDRSKQLDEKLKRLFDVYTKTKEPLKINFRQEVEWLKHADRYTHLMHVYPAKLLGHIPHFFLNNSILSKPGDIVADPFCGSGTVPLEALISGRKALGFDCNPLARLIAQVKVTPLDIHRINRVHGNIIKRLKKVELHIPSVVNLDYWYSPEHITQLGLLKSSIDAVSDLDVRNFFLVCFSAAARKLSYADPHISVPVRWNPDKENVSGSYRAMAAEHFEWLKKTQAIDVFNLIVSANLRRLVQLNEVLHEKVGGRIYLSDARELKTRDEGVEKKLKKNSVQLIITSPPYAGAQKYVRSASLSLGWLGFAGTGELRPLERQTIGREHYPKAEYSQLHKTLIDDADVVLNRIYQKNPLRAHIAANYLLEMEMACERMVEVLKPGGYLVLVIGNNQVCGEDFFANKYLREIFVKLGLELKLELVDDIHSRGLMTKRNKTASLIACEWILLFSKS